MRLFDVESITMYQVICCGCFGDPDYVEYIAPTKAIAEEYIALMGKEYSHCFKYRIDTVQCIYGIHKKGEHK